MSGRFWGASDLKITRLLCRVTVTPVVSIPMLCAEILHSPAPGANPLSENTPPGSEVHDIPG